MDYLALMLPQFRNRFGKNLFVRVLVLLIYLVSTSLIAQSPKLRHYTVEDGLCSSHVYHVIQDSKGYIWIATLKGVSKFDGYEFKNFTIKDGLPSNDVWGLIEDEEGRIWLSTFNKLAYIQNDVVHQLTHPDVPLNGQMLNHVLTNNVHHVKISRPSVQLISISKDLKVSAVEQKGLKSILNPNYYLGYSEKNNIVFESIISDKNSNKNLACISGEYFNDPGRKLQKLISSKFNKRKLKYINVKEDQIQVLAVDTIYEFQNEIIKAYPLSDLSSEFKEIQSVAKIFGSENLILLIKGKYYVCDENYKLVPGYEFLSNFQINTASLDRSGNLWICTTEGLMMLSENSKQSKSYFPDNVSNREIYSMAKDKDGNLWLGGADYGLYLFQDENLHTVVRPGRKKGSIDDLLIDSNGGMLNGGHDAFYLKKSYLDSYLETGEYLNYSENNSLEFQDLNGRYLGVVNVKKMILDGDDVWMSHNRLIDKFRLKNDTRISIGQYSVSNTYAMAMSSSNELILGLADGILKIKNETIVPHHFRHPIFSSPINDLQFDDDEYLWIATDGLGLYRYKMNQIDTIKNLEGIAIKNLLISENGKIWAASNFGVHCLTIESKEPLKYTYNILNTAHGLLSNEVNDLEYMDNKLYVANKNGLSVVNIDSTVFKINEAPLYISNISINGRDTILHKEYTLSHDENNIVIDYVNLSYKSEGNITYQYKMEGVDQEWETTFQRYKEYPKLPSGTYTFKVRAKDVEGQNSLTIERIKFIITPPWWYWPWFWVMVAGLFIAGVMYINRREVNRVKRQAEEQNKINQKFSELELQALQAQMNPHFIFNALHAIQDFIFNKDERTANHYLVKFSRLMRLFLESTKEKVIVLEDEMKLLRLYIELEELRFEDRFDTEFVIDPNAALSTIEIPSMILQPFVENAINHGLLYKESKGHLKISVQKNEFDLLCIIEDDGVGRKKATEIRAKSFKGYRSRGMGLVSERTKIFNLIEQTNLQIKTIDLMDESGKGLGTRVEVSIPLQQ